MGEEIEESRIELVDQSEDALEKHVHEVNEAGSTPRVPDEKKIAISKSNRLTTKTSIVLALVTIFFLNIVAQCSNYASEYKPFDRLLEENEVADYNDDDTNDFSDIACGKIFEKTSAENPEERCNFAKTCSNGDGFPFAPSVFCSEKYTYIQMLAAMAVPLFILLVLLFRMLGSTAEDFFSPSLEMFSRKLGLPPRFAGVTLLALGNGAADVSATINAITSNPEEGYLMALGALTGAAMFIGTVVAGIVIVTAHGINCRGALVRDVTTLAITVVIVYIEFQKGQIGNGAIYVFFTFYISFVGIVLIADIYHRKVVLPRMQARVERLERRRQLEEEKRLKENVSKVLEQQSGHPKESLEALSNIVSDDTLDPPVKNKTLNAMLQALSNYESNDDQHIVGSQSHHDLISNDGWGVVPDEDGMERMINLHGKDGVIVSHHHPNTENQDSHDEESPYHAMLDGHFETDNTFGTDLSSSNSVDWVSKNIDEFASHWLEYYLNIFQNEEVNFIDKFLLLCEFPFTFLRQMTVPIPTDGFYCRPLVAISCISSPFLFAFYLWYENEINAFGGSTLPKMIIFIAITLGVGLSIAKYAPPGNMPMKLAYAGPIAFYGFIMAAVWIDLIAGSLVELLQFLGILFGIPSSILGLTILAWGNSMGDLSANITMARKGLANMAITACYAGPIFNILVGLGAGFSSLKGELGKEEIEVQLSLPIDVGFGFTIIMCCMVLTGGLFFGKGYISGSFGYISVVLYVIYVITSISVEYVGG